LTLSDSSKFSPSKEPELTIFRYELTRKIDTRKSEEYSPELRGESTGNLFDDRYLFDFHEVRRVEGFRTTPAVGPLLAGGIIVIL
jgi:hypothetical protein